MPTFYVDETGFTGEDLMEANQPIFVQATHDFDAVETAAIVRDFLGGVKATELKHKNLARKEAHTARIAELVRFTTSEPGRVATWVSHKEFAAVTMLVEWWVEPLAHNTGFNLYKDGANHAMANMLYVCLGGFWDERFRRKLLLAFQRMVRARTKERFDEFGELVEKAAQAAVLDESRSEILRYLIPSFTLLGFEHIRGLPPHVLDLALPGLIRLGFHWRSRHEGPWEVVHDRSSNMAKQKWMWDRFSSRDFEPAQFGGPHGDMIFPMNVASTRFADSTTEKQIQLCDILAGATAAAVRLPKEDPYRTKLWDAGIEKLVIDAIWPTSEISPEELGRKGWDGNAAIEWITAAMERQSKI